MSMLHRWLTISAVLCAAACSSESGTTGAAASSGTGGSGGGVVAPPWLENAHVVVEGLMVNNDDCRKGICRHNENTDLVTFAGSIFFVHRTAESQVLGPNSSLHIYQSKDLGKTFTETAVIPAPADRDIRDPHFYIVGNTLHIKALARLPVTSTRDSNVDTEALGTTSTDGKTWTAFAPLAPSTWSFWRIKEQKGTYYSAAYEDGDKSVYLYSSTDGDTWTKGAAVYTMSADTPLETELTFMPSGKLLALVRMDGTDDELLGDVGRLRTAICWSDPPYDTFNCPDAFMGQRLDGPLSFFHNGRLFVVARKHLQGTGRKRTSLFEIKGDLMNGGKISIQEWGELPSAGDTSYAGQATVDADRVLVTWYSGDLVRDDAWIAGILLPTDIWQGTINFSKL